MKKNYIAPEAALVNFAAESNMMLTLSFTDVKEIGTDETVGSNSRFEEDWDDEF